MEQDEDVARSHAEEGVTASMDRSALLPEIDRSKYPGIRAMCSNSFATRIDGQTSDPLTNDPVGINSTATKSHRTRVAVNDIKGRPLKFLRQFYLLPHPRDHLHFPRWVIQ